MLDTGPLSVLTGSRTMYSTRKVAKLIGVHFVTLHRWIEKGRVSVPTIRVGSSRLWTDADVARLKREMKRVYHPNKARRQKAKRGQ